MVCIFRICIGICTAGFAKQFPGVISTVPSLHNILVGCIIAVGRGVMAVGRIGIGVIAVGIGVMAVGRIGIGVIAVGRGVMAVGRIGIGVIAVGIGVIAVGRGVGIVVGSSQPSSK